MGGPMASEMREADGQSVTTRDRFGGNRLTRYEDLLWGLVVVTLIADVLSTAYGLMQGQTEGNPLVRVALSNGGFLAFGALKLAVLGVAFLLWVSVARDKRVVIPLGLALPWGTVALLNVVTIVVAGKPS